MSDGSEEGKPAIGQRPIKRKNQKWEWRKFLYQDEIDAVRKIEYRMSVLARERHALAMELGPIRNRATLRARSNANKG